jgi:hypothetical protein
VYVVLSHDNPEQVERLVGRLEAGDPSAQVVLAHDSTRTRLDESDYRGRPRVHLLASVGPRRWGRWSVTEGVIEALTWALDNLAFDWLTLLSGQDYPLGPLSEFREALAESEFDAFISAECVPAPTPLAASSPLRYMQARYFFRWYELSPRFLQRAARLPFTARALAGVRRRISFSQPFVFLWSLPRNGGEMVGFRRQRVPFDEEFRCYSGSMWLTLSRRAVATVNRFVGERPDVVDLYRRSIISDESLLPTIIGNSPELRVRWGNHVYSRMAGPGEAHSVVFGREDLDELLASGQPFARKFDQRLDSKVLDLLDARLEGR